MEVDNENTYEFVESIANSILQSIKCRPTVGIVCGSGLGCISDDVQEKEVLNYSNISGFPRCTG